MTKIDNLTKNLANVYSWFVFVMMGLIVVAVSLRYFFGVSLSWSNDLVWQLYGSLIIFGCSYALQKKSHVRTDIYWSKWSNKTRATIDLISYLFLFFPAIGILFWISVGSAMSSVIVDERSSMTASQMIVWPLKVGIALGLSLLLLQALSETIKCVNAIRSDADALKYNEVDL
jgi:TRAP-type mannitol/chloroaromatic compound transport system permease small subunit